MDVTYSDRSNMIIEARRGATTVEIATLLDDKVDLKEGDTLVIRPLEQSPSDLKLP